MKTAIYTIEEDFNTFENIVKDNKSEAFYSIEKAIADAGEFHVIHLVSTNKETLKELRVPLAYFIGIESDEALKEEKLIIQEANKRLYKALLSNLNIVRSGIGMSQKTIGPFVKKDAEMITDPKGFFNKEDLEAQGYNVKVYNLEDSNNFHSWNPYRALEQLEKENPIKYQEVIKELVSLIKNDE